MTDFGMTMLSRHLPEIHPDPMILACAVQFSQQLVPHVNDQITYGFSLWLLRANPLRNHIKIQLVEDNH
jgi:hypothetical protein